MRIALASALNGYKVIIYDIQESAFVQAKKIQTNLLKILVREGVISEKDSEKAWQNQTFTTDAKLAATNADLVSESVTEDLELKKKVWAKFGKLCPKETIFTTNTSHNYIYFL